MVRFIRNLSVPMEVCLILFLCCGLTIAASCIWIFHHLGYRPSMPSASGLPHPISGAKDVVQVKNVATAISAICDLILLGILSWIGKIRGWSLKSFGMQISWKWTGLGLLLFLALRVANYFVELIMHSLQLLPTGGTPAYLRVSHLTLPFVILICLINPVIEETIESGYLFHVLQRHGMWVTIFATAFFRGFIHVTMGLNGFVTMFVMGLLYGSVYWKWRQLWPLILAHGLQMLFALVPPALGG